MKGEIKELRDMLKIFSQIGADPAGGITRLLYSDAWKQAQKKLKNMLQAQGFNAYYDDVGNLFGLIEGTEDKEELILTGSHIDTVRSGGMLDGQYGIFASFLAIKNLLAKYGRPKKSLEVVSFAEEEGSRFPYAFWGSKNLVGSANKNDLSAVVDTNGVSFKAAMQEAGFDFANISQHPAKKIAAFIEIHIEQGAVLEHAQKRLGVVTAFVGQKRFDVVLKGTANHAGTTPMNLRKDALEGASRIIVTLLDKAKKIGDPLVLTFGHIVNKPNVVNVVPGEVMFTIDTRHTDAKMLDLFTEEIFVTVKKIAESLDLICEVNKWMDELPVPTDENLTNTVMEVLQENEIDFHIMHSGAGHDSQIIAPVYKTAMLFVPSIDGVSHNPMEDTKIEDLENGVRALEAVLYRLAY